MRVGGLDACRGGWVLAVVETGSSRLDVWFIEQFATAIGEIETGELATLGVDMPIGLPSHDPRVCDIEARARLGKRGSSVFPAPIRGVLHCTDHADANALSTELCGRGISAQTFELLPKIGEVDRLMTPALQGRVIEVHPELSFQAMTTAGAPEAPKRTALGRAQRLEALEPSFGDVSAHMHRRPGSARPDDVLDAIAVAWTAARTHRGAEARLGDGAVDERGLRMEIVT